VLAALSRHKYSLSLTAAAAAWGVATVISKRAVDEIPPLTLLAIQLLVSVGVLAIVVRVQSVGVTWSPQLRRLGVLGLLNPGASYALSLLGLSYISASLSVLLWAVEPLMILAIAWWLLGDRVTLPIAGASLLALSGVLLVILVPGNRGRMAGIALTLGGVAACAVYTVISRKWMEADSTVAIVAVQQSCALVFSLLLLAATTLIDGTAFVPEASAGAWISAAVSGVLYYGVAFWFYLTGLRRVPAVFAGLFINLVPVFGIAAGHLLLAERLAGRQWLGALLIVAAIASIALQQSPNST
jgi:drug/metabolite transporter (DMT)-like permease